MGISVKTENRKLYFCDDMKCRVVTFVPEANHDICPGCGKIGLLMRGPVQSLPDRQARLRVVASTTPKGSDPGSVSRSGNEGGKTANDNGEEG